MPKHFAVEVIDLVIRSRTARALNISLEETIDGVMDQRRTRRPMVGMSTKTSWCFVARSIRSHTLTAKSAIRSRSVTIFSVIVMKRRSEAIGCRHANNCKQSASNQSHPIDDPIRQNGL